MTATPASSATDHDDDTHARVPTIAPFGTYELPVESRPVGDVKDGRRRVLCTDAAPEVMGTLVYVSSQEEPLGQSGLDRVPVVGRGTPNPNGFTINKQLYMFPLILWYAYASELIPRLGDLAQHESDPLKRALRTALGVGTGCGPVPDYPSSRRGCIVQVSDEIAERHRISHALILSNHRHAGEVGHQAIVPLLRVGEHGPQPHDVHAVGPWTKLVGARPGCAVWATSMVFSIFEPEDPLGEPLFCVSNAELQGIETALAARGMFAVT